MNKQFEIVNGQKVNNKIEWTDYTWNPLVGCQHGCRWTMPNNEVVICYAEKQVESRWLKQMYPEGFATQYWKPERLTHPLKVKTPSRVFVGSVTDVLGHWQDENHIQAIIDIARKAHWHTFQFLTKNPVRAKDFDWPDNVWIGTSSPPNFMWNKELDQRQMQRMLFRGLDSLRQLHVPVRWMSIEPLSYDIGNMMYHWLCAGNGHEKLPLEWAVVGAASDGNKYYQPDPAHLLNLLEVLKEHHVKIFFKGNLRPSLESKILSTWREEFPDLNLAVQS